MVEAEQKKSADKDGEIAALKEKVAKSETKTSENGVKSEEVNGAASKKRAREEDEEAAPDLKKVDTKSEAVKATS